MNLTQDKERKEEIKKAILFFLESGYTEKDEIYNKIVKDFKVSKADVMEIVKELKKELAENEF